MTLKSSIACLLLATLFQAVSAVAASDEEQPLMRVAENGALLLRGQPYRGIGVNYFDAFQRRLLDHADLSYREGFQTLAAHEIPFVRFMAGGFWPCEWALYQSDRDAYFALMDDVVNAAHELGIGLVPSLFWWLACTPDLAGEPVNAWGNPESKTHVFMMRYAKEMVERYQHHPAIWAWEFGNEYNLSSDLPNAMDHLPWTPVELGAPATRSKNDILTGTALTTALQSFGETIRRLDPVRPITSGHAIPRPSAFHQRLELSWKRDSREQHIQEMLLSHPEPLNLLSIHLYPDALQQQYFDRDDITYALLLDAAMDASRHSGKPLFVGEFGVPSNPKGEDDRIAFNQILRAVVDSDVPLAAFWVFDYKAQESQWSISKDNGLAYRLEMIRAANQELQSAAPLKTAAP